MKWSLHRNLSDIPIHARPSSAASDVSYQSLRIFEAEDGTHICMEIVADGSALSLAESALRESVTHAVRSTLETSEHLQKLGELRVSLADTCDKMIRIQTELSDAQADRSSMLAEDAPMDAIKVRDGQIKDYRSDLAILSDKADVLRGRILKEEAALNAQLHDAGHSAAYLPDSDAPSLDAILKKLSPTLTALALAHAAAELRGQQASPGVSFVDDLADQAIRSLQVKPEREPALT